MIARVGFILIGSLWVLAVLLALFGMFLARWAAGIGEK